MFSECNPSSDFFVGGDFVPHHSSKIFTYAFYLEFRTFTKLGGIYSLCTILTFRQTRKINIKNITIVYDKQFAHNNQYITT